MTIDFTLMSVEEDGSLVDTFAESTSKDQRYFKLPAYSLEASTEYALAVTAVDASAGTNVTSTVALSVGRADVVAVIAGGDRVLPLAAGRRRIRPRRLVPPELT